MYNKHGITRLSPRASNETVATSRGR